MLSLLLTLGVAGGGARTGATAMAAPVSPLRDLRAGLAYVWSTPPVRAALYLAFLVNLTAFPLTGALLAHVARNIYHLDQRGLGWLVASFATGALIGSVALSVRGPAIRPARAMIVYGVFWYLATIGFAQAGQPVAGCAILLLAGLAQSLCMVPMAVTLLRTVPASLRGCVMGVRMLAVYGYPVGLLSAGPLTERFGFATTASAYCVVGLAFLLVIAVRWRAEFWRTDAAANTYWRPRGGCKTGMPGRPGRLSHSQADRNRQGLGLPTRPVRKQPWTSIPARRSCCAACATAWR
jgi:hypothetical protein